MADHSKEVLTNNTTMHRCAQCKDCKFNNDGTEFGSRYDSGSCIMYPYPGHKPLRVLENDGFCDYRKERRK